MGLMQELYKTYEHSLDLVGRADSRGRTLLPIAHSTANAQIEIAIDLDGAIKGAKQVEKVQAVTIIPVTEDSGSRSSGIAPHPLFDKLCYIAGDYAGYVDKPKAEEFYEAYIGQLGRWHDAGCHEYVEAVYRYVSKKSMIKDLLALGVLVADETGMLSEKVKIEGIAQTDVFVRFYIQDENVGGLGEVWKERDVYEDYINYYLSIQEGQDLDYITGEIVLCSEKHPSKIRNSGDKAKLISANDSSGFTYRGRFSNRSEALSVGYVTSQKMHNALKWLIERQGYTRYGLCAVIWNPAGKEVPGLKGEVDDLIYGSGALIQPELGEEYAQRVYSALRGRYADIDTVNTDIVVLFLDAATPGRLSVAYYEQIYGSEFLRRLSYWYSTCIWEMQDKHGRGRLVKTPELEEITQAAFGNERSGRLEVDDKLMKATVERLMPCVISKKPLPRDIVRAAVVNASRPQAFSHYNYRRVLEVTCALIYKTYQDNNRKELESMSLDRNRQKRDYLYGRLLAVAHKVEYDTFSENERGKRETNVNRLMSKMSRCPARTWGSISGRLLPYWRKLHPGVRVRYEKELQEIYDLFKPEEFASNQSLSEEYLLGYSCELTELWQNNKAEDGGNGYE